MEKYLTTEFNEFLNTLNNFQRKAVLWCTVYNEECPVEYYKLLYDTIDDFNKEDFKETK